MSDPSAQTPVPTAVPTAVPTVEEPAVDEAEVLVEDVSIDGMCGVY
jgi:mycofactocin precursor